MRFAPAFEVAVLEGVGSAAVDVVPVEAGFVAVGRGSDFVTVFTVPDDLVAAVVLLGVVVVVGVGSVVVGAGSVVAGVGVVEIDAPAAPVVVVPPWLVSGNEPAAEDTLEPAAEDTLEPVAEDTLEPADCFSADTEPEPVTGDAEAARRSVGPLPPCEAASACALADTDSEPEPGLGLESAPVPPWAWVDSGVVAVVGLALDAEVWTTVVAVVPPWFAAGEVAAGGVELEPPQPAIRTAESAPATATEAAWRRKG